MWKNHPKGLLVLFFTEMWERFGYYTMLAILALYMDEHFALPKNISANIYGAFVAFVYFTPLFGGGMADKWLGYGKSIIIGSVLMAVGYVGLAIDNFPMFCVALGVVSLGNGFFKPNISTMLGNLYGDNNPNKDAGYNIFYMGINIGAFFSPIAAAYLRNNFGWGYAFGAAGAGMMISLFIFLAFKKYVLVVVNTKANKTADVLKPSPKQEKGRIVSLVIIYAIVILFWMAFHQNGLTLTFWARDCTNTSLSPELFQSVNPFFVVFFTPILVWFWGKLRLRGKEPTTPGKIALGMLLTAIAFSVMMIAGFVGGDTGRVSVLWLVTAYAVVTLGELCLSPMGLSLANKLAPPRMRGLMMGGWFLSTSIGNYLSGFVGSYWERIPHSKFFGILTVTSLIAVALMYMVMNKVNRSLNAQPEAEEIETSPAVVTEEV